MASQLYPCISFDGDTRQTMSFYKNVFGSTVMVDAFGEYGPADAPADRLLHAHWDTDSGFGVSCIVSLVHRRAD